MTTKPSIAIIGAGRVGGTLSRLLFASEYRIAAVHSRTESAARRLADDLGAQVITQPESVADLADFVLLTVPDDQIAPVAQRLAIRDWTGKSVVHTSGAASLDRLQSLADAGARVGCLHPAYPIAADVPSSIGLHGATFALEASHPQLEADLRAMVAALGGQPLMIPSGKKAQYHAALAIASNYTVTLYALAHHLLRDLGADDSTAYAALDTLLGATVANIFTERIPDALTGPLTRSDTGTIRAHLDALSDDPVLAELYRGLVRASLPLLRQRGLDTHNIEQLLQDD